MMGFVIFESSILKYPEAIEKTCYSLAVLVMLVLALVLNPILVLSHYVEVDLKALEFWSC